MCFKAQLQAQPDEIEQFLIKRGVKAIPRKSAEIVLDFDATDDPLHGSQQGAYFHGYYRHYCFRARALIKERGRNYLHNFCQMLGKPARSGHPVID